MGLAVKRVRDSMTMHFGYKATYGSWSSKEYGYQTKYREFFCYAEQNWVLRLASPSSHWQVTACR